MAELWQDLLAVFDAAKVPERFRVLIKDAERVTATDSALTAAKEELIIAELIAPPGIALLRKIGPSAAG